MRRHSDRSIREGGSGDEVGEGGADDEVEDEDEDELDEISTGSRSFVSSLPTCLRSLIMMRNFSIQLTVSSTS